jgi:hypothetical protein
MAAIETFNWLVHQIWHNPDTETQRFILAQRKALLDIRSEDERTRFVADFVDRLKELKKQKVVS